MNGTNSAQRLQLIQKRIKLACQNYDRLNKIRLIGASKTKPATVIRELFNLGLTDFGENYLSEAIAKQSELADLGITWHFIGQIQSNKTKQLAKHFNWIHGVDRLKIAQRLNEHNSSGNALNILLQINLDNESSKSGIKPNEAIILAKQIFELPNLSFRGLMALPKPRQSFAEQKACLLKLNSLLADINKELHVNLDSISAGMSNDLEAAIAAGTTMVRIGTDLFGARA